MASKRLFGGVSLGEIAAGVRDRTESLAVERGALVRPVVPAAELALGRGAAPIERENIYSVDPKRVRPWVRHDRGAAWYTRERCLDLIESIAKDGQLAPAIGRRVTGDPNVDYELISGMRRRFACEFLSSKLKLKVIDADDARAAVLMHAENADRQDISPMERAQSFQGHLDAGLFPTQDSLAEAMGLSKGQVAKMLKAASLLKIPALAALLADVTAIPVKPAYKLASVLEREGAREVVLQAAQNLARKKEARTPAEVLKILLSSLDNTRKFEPVQRAYNVGSTGKIVVTRNKRGKVTLAFPGGLAGVDREAVLAAVGQVVADLS